MRKLAILSSLLIALLISSCNKNYKVSKQIDGEWNIDECTIEKDSNGTIIYNESFYNFGTFLFRNETSMGVLDTQVGSFYITKFYLTYDGTVLNVEYDSSGDYVEYDISNYNKKSSMMLSSESTSQGVTTKTTYSLSKN
jgi:hypothetical protein